MREALNLPRAIETFVRGFAFTRSFTHPFIPEKLGTAWVVRDGPRKSGDARVEEYVSCDLAPAALHRLAQQNARGRHALCPILPLDQPDAEFRAAFKKLRCSLRTTEPMMIHGLAGIPQCSSPAAIQRVLTQELADRLAKAARARQILPEYLHADAPLRQYVALMGEKCAGWVRSIVVGPLTWCSNMYVLPEFRRQGIARAMLCQMLRDDRAAGATAAILLASHVGAKLYAAVGYRQIATLYVYTSPRK